MAMSGSRTADMRSLRRMSEEGRGGVAVGVEGHGPSRRVRAPSDPEWEQRDAEAAGDQPDHGRKVGRFIGEVRSEACARTCLTDASLEVRVLR
jgi:hypothetical protein